MVKACFEALCQQVSEGTEKKKKFPKYDQTQGLISTKEEY
jgi:hypothetical protein